MTPFIGRDKELQRAQDDLDRVRQRSMGIFLALRGRRQVGKSRLMEEFIKRAGAKAVFYVASRQDADRELEAFRRAIATSPTEAATIARAGPLGSWEAAFALLASEATANEPIVIVIDEFPYLAHSHPPIEAILQKVWDRTLEHRPVLLILVGSDLSMMEALTSYDRPLYGRPEERVISPLSPYEIAQMLALDPADALDAYLVLGGFPRLASRWHRGDDLWRFLKRELSDPESSLIVLGERMLTAEFPADLKAQAIVQAIGSGERGFTRIQRLAGVSGRTLDTSLVRLENDKRVIVKALPYSATPRPKLSRYTVADPYLRFWLRFLEGQLTTVQRARGDVVLARIKASWNDYRARAIEPIIRTAIERQLPDARFGEALFVGGFWNRDNSVEVDLVGGTGRDHTDTVSFIGSTKWRDSRDFGRNDFAYLAEQRGKVPGTTGDTRLVGVSRNGFDVEGLDVQLTAADIVEAYA